MSTFHYILCDLGRREILAEELVERAEANGNEQGVHRAEDSMRTILTL